MRTTVKNIARPAFRNAHIGSKLNYPSILNKDTIWFDWKKELTVNESGRVTAWTDVLGKSISAAQTNVDYAPTLYADGIRFDGGNDHLVTAALSLNQPITAYLVVKQVTWKDSAFFFSGLTANAGVYSRTSTPGIKAYAGTASAINNELEVGIWGIVRVRLNGANSRLVVNKGIPTTGNFGSLNMGGITIGSGFQGGGSFSNILLKDLIIRTKVDTEEDELVIIDYLKRKELLTWSFSINTNQIFSHDVTFPNQNSAIYNLNSTTLYSLWDGLVAANPTLITKTELFTDDNGKKGYVYKFKPTVGGTNSDKLMNKIIIISGLHGGERTAMYTLYNVFFNICNSDDPILVELKNNVNFIVVPCANPSGLDARTRTNFNGVDLARNFPTDWVLTEEGSYYSGPSAASEIETVAINNLLAANGQAISFIDFHNFDASPSNSFIWQLYNNDEIKDLSSNFVSRMKNKWIEDYEFFTSESQVGYQSEQIHASPSNHAATAFSMNGAITYEMCSKVLEDTEGSINDSNTITLGYEAFVNYLLMLIDKYK